MAPSRAAMVNVLTGSANSYAGGSASNPKPVGSPPGSTPTKFIPPAPKAPGRVTLKPQSPGVPVAPLGPAKNRYATGAKSYGLSAGSAATSGPVDKTGYKLRDANATKGNTEAALRRRYLAGRRK